MFGAKRLKVSGGEIKSRMTSLNQGRIVTTVIRPRSRLKNALAARGRVTTKVEVTFQPKGALANTLTKRLTLKSQG